LSNVSVISGKSSEELARKLSKRVKANLVKSSIKLKFFLMEKAKSL